jgi:hypothetical protein
MRSRISIALDQDNQPIIEVIWRTSEDVRDDMVKRFLDSYGGKSTLASFYFTFGPENGEAKAKIRPIDPDTYDTIIKDNFYLNSGQ